MTVYQVTGRTRYREHDPGSLFETELDPDVEARAITVGAIRVVERSVTGLQPGSWTLSPGWEITREPKGAERRSSHLKEPL